MFIPAAIIFRKKMSKKRRIRIYYIFACLAIVLSFVWLIFVISGVEIMRLSITNNCGSGEGSACGWAIVALGIPFLFLIIFYSGILTILQKTMNQMRKDGGVQKKCRYYTA